MAYDPVDGYTVLFGGTVSCTTLSTCPSDAGRDTWAFLGGAWTQLHPTVSPPAYCSWSCWNSYSVAASMVYDARDGYVLLLIDQHGGAIESWSFRGGEWTRLTATGLPADFMGATMAYDSADGYAVAQGYLLDYPATAVTAAFEGGDWHVLNTTAEPPARSAESLAYDAADGYVLMFGGETTYAGGSGYLTDTWSFKAGVWTELHPSVSPYYIFLASSMAYDPAEGYVVLVGGITGGQYTWAFRAGDWRTAATGSPAGYSSRNGAGIAYDPNERAIVLFSGRDDTALPGVYGDTWTFRNGNWTQLGPPPSPSPALGPHSMVYDPADGSLRLFTACQAWRFEAGNWTPDVTASLPCGPSFDVVSMTVTYDAAAQGLFLYASGIGPISGGWVGLYRNGGWTHVVQQPYHVWPTERDFPAIAYDARDGYVVMFGGCTCSGDATTYFNDTWIFANGNWTDITNQSSRAPSPRAAANFLYDTADGYTVLFGGNDGGADLFTDTWSFAAGRWAPIATRGVPPLAAGAGSTAYDGSAGSVLLYGGLWDPVGTNVSNRWPTPYFSGETWRYRAGVWSNLTPLLNVSPGPRLDSAMAYDPSIGSVILFGGEMPTGDNGDGTDIGFPVQDTWFWNGSDVRSAGPQNVRFTETGLPTPSNWSVRLMSSGGRWDLTASGTTSISEWLQGGTYRFAVGAPVGYTASPSSGQFTVSAAPLSESVTFSAGAPAGSLVVNATQTDQYSFPNGCGTLPIVAHFDGRATGGTPPYRFVWTLGDGSPEATGQNVTHPFASSGKYNVTLAVTDAAGRRATASLEALLVPPPCPPPYLVQRLAGMPASEAYAILGGTAVAVVAAAAVIPSALRRSRRGRAPPPA